MVVTLLCLVAVVLPFPGEWKLIPITLLLALVILLPIFAWASAKEAKEIRKLQTADGNWAHWQYGVGDSSDVWIGANGIYRHNVYTPLTGPLVTFHVELLRGDPSVLSFQIEDRGVRGGMTRTVKVPVPRGHEDEALALIDRFNPSRSPQLVDRFDQSRNSQSDLSPWGGASVLWGLATVVASAVAGTYFAQRGFGAGNFVGYLCWVWGFFVWLAVSLRSVRRNNALRALGIPVPPPGWFVRAVTTRSTVSAVISAIVLLLLALFGGLVALLLG